MINEKNIQETLLQVISEYSEMGRGYFQEKPILNEVVRRLKIRNNLQLEQNLLTIWHNNFKIGYLDWGYNLDNPTHPFCHLTQEGKEILEKL